MNISQAGVMEHYCRFCEKVFNRSYNRDRHEKQNSSKRFVEEDSYTAEEESMQDEENEDSIGEEPAKFPHSPILHYTCRLLLTENNGKNNVIAVGLCSVFVVSWWRNKGLHTFNRMHNEVWGCAEI